MLYRLYWIFLMAVVGVLLLYNPLISQGKRSPTQQQTFAPGEVLVKFKPKTPKRIILSLKESLKVKDESYISSIEVYHWKGDFDTVKTIAILKKSPHVLYAEPNFEVKTQQK